MTIFEDIKTGIIILLLALVAFSFFSKGLDYWGKSILGMGLLVSLWFIAKFWFTLNSLKDLPRVARIVIPEMLSEFKTYVTGKTYNAEYFRGYYLVHYRMEMLTVAWQKDQGIISMKTCDLESFKRTFDPEAAAPPQQVTTPQVNAGNDSGDVDE